MEDIGWKFEISESGDGEGLNDGGVEAFRDDHLLSLAKECTQNSLDARKDNSRPVILEMNTFYIDQKDFPDIKNLKEIIELQIKYWSKTKSDKSAEKFFKEARKTLDSKKIFCIRVSDFNTTGLEGSKEGKSKPFSRWFKLVRSKGVTDNPSLAGGSFGLGKFASFACSKIRTVIYSTKDLEGIESHQGVSILASYDTKEGQRTRGKGYFCNLKDFSCIKGPIYLDKNFSRESPGTDIYILGFLDEENELEDKIISSILRSFLLAIYNESLIFHLNGKTLEKKNLSSVIDKYRDKIYRKVVPSEIIEYYDILEKKLEFEEYHYSMFEKKDISLKIAIGSGLSKRVGMFRNNGMKILDKIGIKSYNDYTAILILEGNKVNAYFRTLENVEHDNWRAERSDDPKEARKNIQKLSDFIINNLNELENKNLPESQNIEGIDSLLDESFEKEGIKPLEGLKFKPLEVRESRKIKKIRSIIKISTMGGGKGKGDKPIKKPGTGLGVSGPGTKDNKKSIIEVFPNKIKTFQDKEGEYNLLFSLPEESESIKCEILIGGEEFSEIVKIEKASIIKNNKETTLQFKENRIELGPIEKDSSNHIKFKLKEDEKWTLEVNFYEN